MTICSRTIGYCFPYCFWNLIIPKQGTEMQIFFLNELCRFLKNGHLPVKLHSSSPRGSTLLPKLAVIESSVLIIGLLLGKSAVFSHALLLCCDDIKYWSIMVKLYGTRGKNRNGKSLVIQDRIYIYIFRI